MIPLRAFRSRVFQVSSIVAIITFAWLFWWVTPPQPDLRLAFELPENNFFGKVSANGRSLICTTGHFFGNDSTRRINVYSLLGGDIRFTLPSQFSIAYKLSPDGSQLCYCDSSGTTKLISLPSGSLVRVLTKGPSEIEWTPDGTHFFVFDSGLTVFRSDSGQQVGRFSTGDFLACRSNSSGFATISADQGEIINVSFDSIQSPTTVKLPWPPAYGPGRDNKRPESGSVYIRRLATNNDGSAIFLDLSHYLGVGGKEKCRDSLARWDQPTQLWSEDDCGPHGGWLAPSGELQVSPSGRLVTNGFSKFQDFHSDEEAADYEEAKAFAGRFLWDARTAPPKCLNDKNTSISNVSFSPSGREIIDQTGRQYTVFSEADLTNSRLVFESDEPPQFSYDGNFVACLDRIQSQMPSWIPSWSPNWFRSFFAPCEYSVRVIRLSDAKTVRHLSNRASPTMTSDGYLWTVTSQDRTDESITLVAERWSPEEPWPPWWLMLLSGMGLVVVAWELRRCRRS